MKFSTLNPATEEKITEYDIMDKQAVNDAVDNAKKSFDIWKETDISDRCKIIKKTGRKLIGKKHELAEAITEEMGKPIKESLAEVEKCAEICEYYSKNAKRFLKDDVIKTEFKESYVTFEPLGVVGSIMPWNYPMSQIFRFAIPSLAVGNAQIVKPSSVTPLSGGINVREIFFNAGLPEHVFSVVIGDASSGTHLAESPIDVISLTGSVNVG